jgi:hypothetical protein
LSCFSVSTVLRVVFFLGMVFLAIALPQDVRWGVSMTTASCIT